MSLLRIVYVGPGMSGRSTSVRQVLQKTGVHETNARDPRQEARAVLGPDLVASIRVSTRRAHTFYGTGQMPTDNALLREEVDWLCEADGVVFVADSQRPRRPGNQDEVDKLRGDLQSRGFDFNKKPLVVQANKRDLPNLLTKEEILSDVLHAHCVYVESVATQGVGVMEAIYVLASLIRG